MWWRRYDKCVGSENPTGKANLHLESKALTNRGSGGLPARQLSFWLSFLFYYFKEDR